MSFAIRAGGSETKLKKGSVAGAAAIAHNHHGAEPIAVAAWRAEEKALVAVLIRKRTGVKNRWVTERLETGHEGSVTRAIRRVSEDSVIKNQLAKLESMLVNRDYTF